MKQIFIFNATDLKEGAYYLAYYTSTTSSKTRSSISGGKQISICQKKGDHLWEVNSWWKRYKEECLQIAYKKYDALSSIYYRAELDEVFELTDSQVLMHIVTEEV